MRTALALVASSLAVVAVAGSSLEAGAQRPVTPAVTTTSLSGRDIFQFHCAACHGPGGKGDGPAAGSLRTPPADLTTIAARHGQFPTEFLRRFVAGDEPPVAAHGTRDMPVWGPVFRSQQPHDALADVRIENVVRYIESIQKP
jgi:mono/diheme cytochrome c family protein